ncbi:nuclear pore complex protein NUP1 [Cocos nucifera]|uniref:Nuclear pore complex protein NUP1 n=1 Tax=Cocos nucifera TaxID=13894 RepID=A0A8K0MY09_COCNU|nr:nuclear pore complex protein NUP1 [Cocos nucifera]
MAAAAYEGGSGGKFPKRPSRRAPTTPYDRPPAAARGVRHPAAAEPGGSRWLSKLVDPASRIIARSASRLFSSVFRKRLAAPPAAPEENHLSRQEDPELPSTNSSSEVGEQCGCGGEKAKDNCDAPGAWEEMNLDIGGISELEHLLKQKTFTRKAFSMIEFDRLTELLRSRTIEPSTSQPAVNYVNEEKANISEQVNQNKESTAEPSTSKPADSHDKKEKPNIPEQEAIASFRLRGSVTTPVRLAVLRFGLAYEPDCSVLVQTEWNSSTLPSTKPYHAVSGSTMGRNENKCCKPVLECVVLCCVVPVLGMLGGECVAGTVPIPEEEAASPTEIAKAYMGSRSSKVSPSTISRRSQIFQEDAAPQAKKSLDMAIAPSCYLPLTIAHRFDTTEQALKRGSSVLDSDVGSLGPLRRIRQKSDVMSPSRNIHLQSSLPRNLLPTPFVPLGRDANRGSASSIQKPLHLDGATELQDVENGHDRTPSAGVVSVPPQSSEMARKILQELDKLVPSPNEKSSEPKIIDGNESPSKLTHSMLRGRALKSMEDIDSSKFLKVQAYDNLDIPSSSYLKSIRSSTFQKQERAGENGPSKPDVTRLQAKPEALARNKSVISTTEAKPGMRSADFAISVAAAVPSQNKPSFQMSAPEVSSYSSGLASAGEDELISGSKTDRPEITKLERSLGSSSKSMPNSTLILDKRSEVKASDKPVSEENAAFLFPTASPSSISSQMPSQPMPTPLLERSAQRKEEIAGHTFKFGSKDAQSSPLSSTMTAVSNPVSPKFGASNEAPETLLGGSKSDRGGDQKAGDVFKSCGNAAASLVLSGSTSPALFAFGASTTPTLSNGSLTTASSVPVISAAPAMTFSDNAVTSVFSTSIVTSTSSGGPTFSSATPVSSTVPSFQFGSGASTGASTSATPSSPDQPDFNGLEEKSVKASPFGISSFIASGSSAVHSSTGSNSAASATSSAFASMGPGGGSSVVQASGLFSSTTSSSSLALSTPSVFSGDGVFGSGASARSSSENLSVANSGSQSLPSTFGATGGSIFDTQAAATKPGTGVSHISQNSPSQFGSFNPQPVSGLPGSSSSGSTSSLFVSAATTTKPFGTSSIFPFSTSAGSLSSSASSSVSFGPTSPFGASSGFSFSSGALSSYSSGGGTSFAPTTYFGSSTSAFSAGAGISSSPVSSSSLAPTAANMFNSSSQLPTSSIFGSATPTPSTGFSFGLSAPSSGSSPFTFGTSSGPAFPFTSAGAATSSTSSSPFGVQNPAASFGSGSPGNDQMNVEDSMADDTTQASAPVVPTFGQQTNFSATPSFMFGSPAAPSGGPSIFQFGSQQNTNNPQNPSPFQASGSLEFAAGGSFSLGSGGGDKSGRKIVRVRRDKLRKK